MKKQAMEIKDELPMSHLFKRRDFEADVVEQLSCG